jgi:hypothetical protein
MTSIPGLIGKAANGGGGHFGGGFGGAHVGGGFGGTHLGGGFGAAHLGGQAFGRAFVGPNFAAARNHFDHDRGFGRHFDQNLPLTIASVRLLHRDFGNTISSAL